MRNRVGNKQVHMSKNERVSQMCWFLLNAPDGMTLLQLSRRMGMVNNWHFRELVSAASEVGYVRIDHEVYRSDGRKRWRLHLSNQCRFAPDFIDGLRVLWDEK